MQLHPAQKRIIFGLVCATCLVAVCFLLLPRTLTSYFDLSEPPDTGSVLLLYPTEEHKQVDLYDETELNQLWTAIQNTKVHYAGQGDTFSCDYLYLVHVQSSKTQGYISFDYSDSGHLLFNERKYQITSGKDELLQAIESILKK